MPDTLSRLRQKNSQRLLERNLLMSKRRNKKKNKLVQDNKPDVITLPTFTPEPEYPKFRYLTKYTTDYQRKGWSYEAQKDKDHVITSQKRTLQYSKSADGGWYDIPEESEVNGASDTRHNSFFPFWF